MTNLKSRKISFGCLGFNIWATSWVGSTITLVTAGFVPSTLASIWHPHYYGDMIIECFLLSGSAQWCNFTPTLKFPSSLKKGLSVRGLRYFSAMIKALAVCHHSKLSREGLKVVMKDDLFFRDDSLMARFGFWDGVNCFLSIIGPFVFMWQPIWNIAPEDFILQFRSNIGGEKYYIFSSTDQHVG